MSPTPNPHSLHQLQLVPKGPKAASQLFTWCRHIGEFFSGRNNNSHLKGSVLQIRGPYSRAHWDIWPKRKPTHSCVLAGKPGSASGPCLGLVDPCLLVLRGSCIGPRQGVGYPRICRDPGPPPSFSSSQFPHWR